MKYPLRMDGLVPDALFAVQGDRLAFYALEADRGTETVKSDIARTAYGRKLPLYIRAFDDGTWRTRFGIFNPVILTVTTSPKRIETMLDYLLTHKWVALRKDGTVSTVWQSNPAHQLAWVRAGRRVNPSKYYLTYWKHAYLSDICWFSPWTMTFDPVGSYFKFNLEHGAFYTFLRLESNPWVWQRGYKGFRILRKALAHHLQAHFNMCTVGIAPWQALQIGPETRTLLRLFLKRPRRHVNVSVSGVETVPYTPPGVESGLFGALDSNAPTGPSTISKYPLPPDKRPSTDFLWQRDSFRLSSWGDGTKEGPGVDYTLPYWMGRYYGVLAN